MRGISTLGGECPRGSSTPESPRGVSACVAFFYFRVQRYTQATQPCLHLSHSNTGTKRQQETLVVVGVVGEGWFGLVPSGFASPGWGAGGLRLDDERVELWPLLRFPPAVAASPRAPSHSSRAPRLPCLLFPRVRVLHISSSPASPSPSLVLLFPLCSRVAVA
jgi:hypothetical protein